MDDARIRHRHVDRHGIARCRSGFGCEEFEIRGSTGPREFLSSRGAVSLTMNTSFVENDSVLCPFSGKYNREVWK